MKDIIHHSAHLPTDHVINIALLIACLPFAVFLFLLLFGRVVNKYRGIMATAVMFCCTVLAFYVFYTTWNGTPHHMRGTWFYLGQENPVTIGVYIDTLSALFLFVVLFISFLVHLFSIEYLRGDKNFEKYFAYLGLFTFSMIGIILADNLLLLFIFWELVGFSSYLLIGFWFDKPEAIKANMKAFITNRIGDIGFLAGILIIWNIFGTLDIVAIPTLFSQHALDGAILVEGHLSINEFWITVAGLGLFMGCVAKSAQFPLSNWLPHAMEGPTPVSALIHAATMVAAGVYLLARIFPLLHPDALDIIAVIGTITLFTGAFAAMAQTDIKRVLAYSTVSQLGYMIMAIGIGAYDAALFHLMTHAFFKACLFLCAGAVIHAMHGVEHDSGIEGFDSQDMRFMGNLRKKLPVTFITYTLSAAALIGLPFFSGFLSKDTILNAAWFWADGRSTSHFVWYLIPVLGMLTSAMTAFYMTRQYILVFWGKSGLGHMFDKIKDVPKLMKIPTIILAVLSLWFFYAYNPFNPHSSWFLQGLTRPISVFESSLLLVEGIDAGILIPILIFALVIVGMLSAYYIYGKQSKIKNVKQRFFSPEGFLYKLSYNNWYIDNLYNTVFVRPIHVTSKVLYAFDKYVIDQLIHLPVWISLQTSVLIHRFDTSWLDKSIETATKANVVLAHILSWVDKRIIDGFVNFTASFGRALGYIVRYVKKGQLHWYWMSVLFAIVAVLLYMIL